MAKKTFDQIVGERIRTARTAAGMTQVQLAEKAGTNAPQLSRYEHGDSPAPVLMLAAFARVLKCKTTDFIEGVTP